MLVVLQALREMERKYHVPPPGPDTVGELLALRQALDEIRAEQAQSDRRRREGEEQRARQCVSCGEATTADRGLGCARQPLAHFLCDAPDCFSGFVGAQFGRLAAFTQRGCKIVCVYCAAEGAVCEYAEKDVVVHLTVEAYGLFEAAKRRVLERQVADRVEAQTREAVRRELEAERSRADRVLIHKKQIEGHIPAATAQYSISLAALL
jgi:hypothetical protein